MKPRIQKLLSTAATVAALCTLSVPCSAQIMQDRSFQVHGVSVERTSAPHVANCFEYAETLYGIIWGKSFDSSYKGDSDAKNMLYGLSDEQRLITAEHTKAFIRKAKLGSVIRITNAPSSSYAFQDDGTLYGGKYGHNVILTDRDEDGFWCLEDWRQMSLTSYYTWEEFGKQYNTYTYYKYIKYPVKKKVKKAAAVSSVPKETLPEALFKTGVHNSDLLTFESFEEKYKYTSAAANEQTAQPAIPLLTDILSDEAFLPPAAAAPKTV